MKTKKYSGTGEMINGAFYPYKLQTHEVKKAGSTHISLRYENHRMAHYYAERNGDGDPLFALPGGRIGSKETLINYFGI